MSTLDISIRGAHLPGKDEQIALTGYHIQPGGAGLNTCAALSFLGIPVVLASRVGTDAAGRLIQGVLAERQIVAGQVTEDSVLQTSFSLINVFEDGEIGLLHHEGANININREDISAAKFRTCEVIHVAGAMSLQGLDGEPTAQLMIAARALGKTTSLSTSRLTTRSKCLQTVLPHLDLIFTNRHEALAITSCDDYVSAAAWLNEHGVRRVVITLGQKGAYVYSADFSGTVKALPVYAADTTGCGDAFVGGFLYGVARGLSTEACAIWGNALGSHCARTPCALVSAFSIQEIEAMIRMSDRYDCLAALVLAGGRSRRMEGTEQKLVLDVCGRPLIEWVVEALRRVGIHRIIILLGHQAIAVESALHGQPVEFFKSTDCRNGTGGAVKGALNAISDLPRTVVVVNGDTPLLRPETIRWLIERHFASQAAASVVTAESPNTHRYAHGLILRDPSGAFNRVAHFSQIETQAASQEVNTGTYCFQCDLLRLACKTLSAAADGLEHLSDVLAVLDSEGKAVVLERHFDFSEFASANTRQDLREIESHIQERLQLES